MSTLIGELDEKPALGDGDLVQNILAEMNGMGGASGGGSATGGQMPPALQGGVINAPNPNSVAQHTLDNGPATSHIIGGQHPSPGDFQQAMYGGGQGGKVQPADSWGAGMAEYAPAQQARAPAVASKPAGKSFTARVLDEFRIPFFVVILVFVFSLPVVNFLFAHYVPWMTKPTGELTTVGLLVKSVGAGAAFWIIQRVIVPLLSL